MSPNKFASRDELKFKVNYERLSCSVILNCNSHVFFSKNHRIESVENLEVSFQYLKKANSITQWRINLTLSFTEQIILDFRGAKNVTVFLKWKEPSQPVK